MSVIDPYEKSNEVAPNIAGEGIRGEIVSFTKSFKTSWVALGERLYPVWRDKLYLDWGYKKFEDYTQKELGLKHTTAVKMLKNYFFLEQKEPVYLTKEFVEKRNAPKIPNVDAVNVLRMAGQKKELTKEDYAHLKQAVFEKGADASVVRKDLTNLMKERKQVDPDKERQERHLSSLRKLTHALRAFKKDMTALKLGSPELVEETNKLLKKLESEIEQS